MLSNVLVSLERDKGLLLLLLGSFSYSTCELRERVSEALIMVWRV